MGEEHLEGDAFEDFELPTFGGIEDTSAGLSKFGLGPDVGELHSIGARCVPALALAEVVGVEMVRIVFCRSYVQPFEEGRFWNDVAKIHTDQINLFETHVMSELKVDEPKVKTSQSEDDQAIAWAKANPNDPRSKLIIELQGR